MIGKNFISSKARISKKAKVGRNVTVCDYAFIGDNVVVGDNSYIGRNVILGEPVAEFYKSKTYKNPATKVGANSLMRSGTIIYAGGVLGDNFNTGHNAVVREFTKFGKNCSFGTLSQSDGYVRVGNNCKFHNNVFIASYTIIKDNVLFYPCSVTLDSPHPPCGKCRKGPTIADDVTIGAGAILLPHIKIARNAVVGARAVVTKNVQTKTIVAGNPAIKVNHTKTVLCKFKKNKRAYA